MTDAVPSAQTLLAVDFGTATTRASVFEVVEGSFRYIASGEAPSTLGAPYGDPSEGLRHALLQLKEVTGRQMLSDAARLIMPANTDGSGCDAFVATMSGAPALRTILVGLLPDHSLRSARRVAESAYLHVVEALSITDGRKQEQQIDAFLKARPEVVIIAGGTDGGAAEATLKLVETVGVSVYLLPGDQRPRVLYTGNAALKERVTKLLSGVTTVEAAPNTQPVLGQDALDAVRVPLGDVLRQTRLAQMPGLTDLELMANGHVYPTAYAEGQVVRFLSRVQNSSRGVLSVNAGSAATSIAAAFKGELYLSVAPDLGVGVNAHNTLNSALQRSERERNSSSDPRSGSPTQAELASFTRWLPTQVSDSDLRSFALMRSVRPHTVPAEVDDLHLDYALARQAISVAFRRARQQWPVNLRGESMSGFDLIIGGGATLGRAHHPGAAALILLDALQPAGVTDLALDTHHILAALGAIAHVNPVAMVQALESEALLSLGTAVSFAGVGKDGAVIASATLANNDGDNSVEVKAGSIEVLALPLGQSGELTIKPRSGVDVGFGPGRGKRVAVSGGVVGVILDGRGRPLPTFTDPVRRAEAVQHWFYKLCGM
ncbi:MAG: glutamate mutase L [Anaerolineales bacterium]